MQYHHGGVSKKAKLLDAVKTNPAGVRFSDLVRLLEAVGYKFSRQVGSHRIYVHPDASVPIVNIQDAGGTAKRYQVEQVLAIIDSHKLEV